VDKSGTDAMIGRRAEFPGRRGIMLTNFEGDVGNPCAPWTQGRGYMLKNAAEGAG